MTPDYNDDGRVFAQIASTVKRRGGEEPGCGTEIWAGLIEGGNVDANERMMKLFSIDNQGAGESQPEAFLDEFKSNDSIYAYVISTSGDEQVCNVCNKHDGKKYGIKDAVANVNFPPFCDNCRCVALPCYKQIKMPWDE